MEYRSRDGADDANSIERFPDVDGRSVACAHSGLSFDTPDTHAYLYNARSEQTNATAAVDSDYRYGYNFDDIGNRKTSSERGTNSVYTASQLNQYITVDDFTPTYDADGNQTVVKTATGIWQITYNGENRPILWVQGTNTISMTYDRMGRRVTKNSQRFVYKDYLQIANFHSTTPTQNFNYYIWDPTEPVATRPLVWRRSTLGTQHSTLFYTHDGNKNVSEVIASDTDVAAHYEYAPFGAVSVQRGVCSRLNPWRFSGEYADDEVGCVYYNFREYEPISGRWMSRDPLDDGNLYAFIGNYLETDDLLGLISVEELFSSYFNPSAVGSFNKDIIRAPLGSGFFVLSASVSIEIFSCCDSVTSTVQSWIEGDAGFEAFYEIGFDASKVYPSNRNIHKYRKQSGYTGKNKKNQMVPHPCNPAEMINIANYNKYASECRKRVRSPHSTLSPGGTMRLCPTKEGFAFNAGIFVRGTMGVGLGVEVDGRIDLVALLWRKESLLDSLSGSAHMTLGVIGATLDVGGWGWASWQKRVE